MKNVLLINAHQRWENFAEGGLTRSYIDLAKKELEQKEINVRVTTVEDGYNIDEEIDNHLWADCVIVQVPMYWMNVPWAFKKYIDDVFTSGLGGRLAYHDGRVRDNPSKRYGTGGTTQGKKVMISVTINAPTYAFNKDEFFEGLTIDQVFIGIHKPYQFSGFTSLPGFVAYDVIKNPQVESDFVRFKAHLDSIFS
ncbi:UNVERIFIED_CONTAM: hypothetical protein GTU68_052149 [Idotea baltica]|nr:hypothetical protein [Idotea baltica]